MKRILAALITVGLLAGVLWWARQRPAASTTGPGATPEACLDRLFQAAAEGDVAAYLDCFTGPERERLARESAGQAPESFARTLREAVAQLKGRAVFPAPQDPPGATAAGAAPTRATLIVERVYASRTEKQTYHLVRDGRTWRIRAVEGVNPTQPSRPYGTPVYEIDAPPK